jgi:hypothetical protein
MVVAFQRVNGTGVPHGRQFTGKATRLQKLPGGLSFRRTGKNDGTRFAAPADMEGREIAQTSQDFAIIAMDFTFKVNLTAVVQVRAADENVARKVVPAVLGAPGSLEIALANENNAAAGHNARVTDVGFSIASLAPINGGGDRAVKRRNPTAPTPAARSRRK